MNESIKKPMIIVRQEFIDKLLEDINNCGLPLFVIEPILRDVHSEIKNMSQKQYEFELAQYNDKMLKMQSKE